MNGSVKAGITLEVGQRAVSTMLDELKEDSGFIYGACVVGGCVAVVFTFAAVVEICIVLCEKGNPVKARVGRV